jgi:hypothetical protein
MSKARPAAIALCVAAVVAAGCTPLGSAPSAVATPAEPTPTPEGDRIAAVGAQASSETAFVATNVLDEIFRTRWRPTSSEVEWIYVDLGESHHITRVVVHWHSGIEGGNFDDEDYATAYELQVSDDAENWTTVRSLTGADGRADDFTGLDATGRYVRVYCTEVSRLSGGPDYYDIWEIEVYGETSSQ